MVWFITFLHTSLVRYKDNCFWHNTLYIWYTWSDNTHINIKGTDMELIPAIDILDGKCVRLVQGDFSKSTVFSGEPVEIAQKWQSQGAKRIHIVDLNGSRKGRSCELETVRKIVDAISIPVQLGGGIRTMEHATQALDTGVDRVIIGTTAALDNRLAETMFSELGEQAILGVDAKDGFVAVQGWEMLTREPAIEFAKRMQHKGVKRVIYTDISRDGMMQGVNLEAMQKMTDALSIPVIASGGVSSQKDIDSLSSLSANGLEGAILGKALYTGAIDLAEAIKSIS